MSIQECDWVEYVETGFANIEILKEIVAIIKKGGVLSDKHLAIYESYNIAIEALLRSK